MRLFFLRTCVFSLCVSASVAMPVYFAIPLLFGSAYDESASLIPILSAATAFFGMSRVAIALSTVANIAFWPTFINVAGVVSSLGFCALLIPHYGALGAAYASLISYGICAGFAFVAVMRLSKSIRATTLAKLLSRAKRDNLRDWVFVYRQGTVSLILTDPKMMGELRSPGDLVFLAVCRSRVGG